MRQSPAVVVGLAAMVICARADAADLDASRLPTPVAPPDASDPAAAETATQSEAPTAAATGASNTAQPHPAAPQQSTFPSSGIYLAVTGLTDYRYDSLSQSNRSPTWQVTIHYFRADGWYAGTVITGVNLLDKPRTTLEWDLYGGKHFHVLDSDLNLEVLYFSNPFRTSPGPTYNTLEPSAELTHSIHRLTLKALLGWSSSYSGETGQLWRVRGTVSYSLASWLDVSGHVGRYWIQHGNSRTHWDIGATANWKRWSLDVRYGAIDLPRAKCFGTTWCGPGVWAALTYRVSP